MMATMRDVATKAQVSIATVSAVVNNTANVRPELTERVKVAIEQVGYRPNTIARSLKMGGTKTLACIVPAITNPVYAEIAQTVETEAYARGYSVFIFSAVEDTELQTSYMQLAKSQQVAGAIVIPAASTQMEVKAMRHELGAPVVVVDRATASEYTDTVTVDNFAASERAVSMMISYGHRRIGVVASYPQSTTSKERIRGYQKAMDKAGLSTEGLVKQNCSNIDRARSAVLELMKQENRPTALFATYDLAGLGVVQVLNSLEMKCPQDISFITFDGGAWADATHPPITRIRQPAEQMGREAVRLLLDRIEANDSTPARHIELPTQLIVKDSCSPPKIGK